MAQHKSLVGAGQSGADSSLFSSVQRTLVRNQRSRQLPQGSPELHPLSRQHGEALGRDSIACLPPLCVPPRAVCPFPEECCSFLLEIFFVLFSFFWFCFFGFLFFFFIFYNFSSWSDLEFRFVLSCVSALLSVKPCAFKLFERTCTERNPNQ